MDINIKELIGKVNVAKAKAKAKTAVREQAQTKAVTLLNKNSGFAITEAYKAVRTNIIFTLSNIEHKCKRIIITSASPGEGKTTTCLNLAIAFAQTGSKVLLIGADLRKPRVYRHLGIERNNGISDVLCGLVDCEQAIKHCTDYGIDCITAGQLPPNPVELLASPKMGEILDQLSEKYDYIFIDTPPVTLVADATAMSKYVDGVIVVVRQNYTIHESLERARSSLDFAEAKILGYILNDVDNLTNRYGNYKRYGYSYGRKTNGYSYGGYGYGYAYGYADEYVDKAENYIGIDNAYFDDNISKEEPDEVINPEPQKNKSKKKK